MGAHQNFIEINGKKYNAATGELIRDNDNQAPVAKKAAPIHATSSGSIDGFQKRPTHSGTTHAKISHAPAKTLHPEPQRSHTLMRSAVKKPINKKLHQPNKQQIKQPTAAILGHSPRRDSHAQQVTKSSLVSRYTSAIPQPVVKKVAPLHVAAHPSTEQPAAGPQHKNNQAAHLIEKALANATGHLEQPTSGPKKKRLHHKLGVSKRAMSVSTVVLAFVVLGGFYAYLNVPNFAMRVAATRAGFGATMPGYKPAGFAFRGPINYTNGQVTVSFRSNTDDRAYQLTQRTSNWSSEALLTNYVATQNKQYQTLEDKGRTLYIYDGSNATWVDNGIWYQLEGDSRMTTDQISRVASSL